MVVYARLVSMVRLVIAPMRVVRAIFVIAACRVCALFAFVCAATIAVATYSQGALSYRSYASRVIAAIEVIHYAVIEAYFAIHIVTTARVGYVVRVKAALAPYALASYYEIALAIVTGSTTYAAIAVVIVLVYHCLPAFVLCVWLG